MTNSTQPAPAPTIHPTADVYPQARVGPGTRIWHQAQVCEGAVVTRDVPPHGVAYGNPARLNGHACRCGRLLQETDNHQWKCEACNECYTF